MSVWALHTLQRVIRDLDIHQDGRQITGDTLEVFIVALELFYRDLIAWQTLNGSAVDRNLEEGSNNTWNVWDEVHNTPNSQLFQTRVSVIVDQNLTNSFSSWLKTGLQFRCAEKETGYKRERENRKLLEKIKDWEKKEEKVLRVEVKARR